MLKRIELEAIERKNGSEKLKNVKTLQIFRKEELDKITMNNSVPLGKGGFGEVHKGVLPDKTEVAVKASIEVTKGTLDKFVEEVEIQSGMMHKNILKLLGCCLRVDVPLLVYEYAAKGSLKDLLHGKNDDGQPREPLTLRSRLDIAIGCAQGLAYMHSYTENGIQHADVKPDNILLDGGLVPKISDFGLSKVSVVGKDYTKNVVGCLPYMDPVYKETGRLTPKSDVYSFGIVLLELISRRPAVDGSESSIVRQFKSVYEQADDNNTGKELFDKDIAAEEDIPMLDEIAKLAMRCLKDNVNERPAMVSVASALVILKDSWEETGQGFSSPPPPPPPIK
jgi:serine/threonine protein kinase